MARVAFDTHAFVKQLRESGFEEALAEALAEAFRKAQDVHLEELATRYDLKELDLKIDNKLESIKGEINLVMGEINSVKWMMGILLAGVVSLILKAFFIP